MSDTDDTDDLLLIPPDFFAIESDSGQSNTDPYYSIVDSLIDQVSNLQNRIKSIESSESFLTNSPNNSYSKKFRMQRPLKEFRRCNSSDDLYGPNSTQSTPQKPHTKFKLNSLPTSPYVDRFNGNRNFLEYKSLTPSPNRIKDPSSTVTKSDNTLSEVDTFLSKVKTIQRLNAVRNLENEFNYDRQNVDIPRKDESETIDKNRRGLNMENDITKENTWQSGDAKESVPDYGLGVREELYGKKLKDSSYSNVNSSNCQTGNENYFCNEFPNLSSITNQNLTSDKSADSESSISESISQITTFKNYNKPEFSRDPIHTNALNILSMHRELTENSAKKTSKNPHREQKSKRSNQSTINDNLALLSLADIWNTTSSQILQLNPSQLLQKLQEEKLRRQHCEDLIQGLQNKNLEMQQKLTVAVKVDDSKNATIRQYEESLQKLMSKLQTYQKEKREWENEKARLKRHHSNEMKESIEKIQYYEKEVSKALNIAHSNHEKTSLLEKNFSDLQNENQTLKKNQKDLEDLLYVERSRNNELSETLNKKELELTEVKDMLNTSKSEIDKTNKTIASYQQEFTKLKEETNRLQDDLRTSNNKIFHYDEERKHIMEEIEESRKRESKLKEDLATLKKQIGQNKLELRNFYQGQMEVLVQNKLKEFQSQLDKSENNFKERELAIAKTAAMHIQDMSQKYAIEIKLLEKKHQEEMKLYQIQIMQYKQQIEDLQTKLNHIQEKRITIAKQLQKIMETQWSEALRIIASGKSPTFNNEESFSTIDQLNSLKTRSYNNLEEILTRHVNENFNPDKDSKGTLSNEEERHHNEDLKYPMETPVSSRTHGNKQYNENDIQKYMNMLLNRPINEGPSREPEDGLNYETFSWMHERGDGSKGNKPSHKDKKLHKPPWK